MRTRPEFWIVFLFSGLFLFCSFWGYASITISGKVISSSDSRPLEGAHIRISGTRLGTVTGKDGTFKIQDIAPGSYKIRATFMGFHDEEKSLLVTKGKQISFLFILIPSSIIGPETEITGKKSEKGILEIPMRINMITSENIRDNPGQSIPQLLDNLSGVNLSSTMGIYGNDNVISIRGLSGNDQGRTLVLLDDIPINKADEGTVNWHLINRDNIEQIKVIKGPGSVIYGSNAMGGIINIKTHIPDKIISGTAAIEYGTYNTLTGRYFISGRTNKRDSNKGFLYNLNGFYTRSNGYNAEIPEYLEKADTFTVNNFVREADLGAKIGYQFNPGSTLDISCNFFNDKRGRGIQIYEMDGAYERHNTWQAAVHYNGGIGMVKWKIHAYNHTEYFERLNEFMREAEYNLYLVKSTRNDRGGLLTVSAGSNKKNLVTGGCEARLGSVDGKDIYYTSTDLISNAGKMENYALFFQDELSLLQNRIEINLGIRFDYAVFHNGSFKIDNPSYSVEYMMNYQDTVIPTHNWMQFDPKLSVQYRFNPTGRIFFTVARGFRAPLLDDLCRTGKMRNGFKISNPALTPEYIDNIELGMDFLLWNKLHFSPSIYYSVGHDFMYYVSTGDSVNMGYKITPIFQKRNISLVDISGVELDLGCDPVSWLSLFANYTYSHSRIRKYTVNNSLVDDDITGKFLTDVPEYKATAGIIWKNKIVSCNITWKYIGSRWINDMNEPDPLLLISKYPSYNTFGFRAWHLFFNHMKLALNIDNIFNVRFVDDKLLRSPGRIMNAEVSVQF
jgi:outer membrane receptor protein involved in Fe transport